MWWIVYRIAVPGLFVMIAFALLAFFQFRSIKKTVKKRNDKKKKLAAIAYLCIALFGAILSIFLSFDLIFQDYITQNGNYEKQYRNRDVYELIFDVDGESKRCFVFPTELKKYDLQEDQTYEVTYARRTGMLISIRRTKR